MVHIFLRMFLVRHNCTGVLYMAGSSQNFNLVKINICRTTRVSDWRRKDLRKSFVTMIEDIWGKVFVSGTNVVFDIVIYLY